MECSICCESKDLLNLQCNCQICGLCMLKSIDAKYLEVIDIIQCPGDCQQKHHIKQLINDIPDLNDVLINKFMKTQKDIRICPKNDCKIGGFITSNCYNFQCECGYQFKIQKEMYGGNQILSFFTIKECPRCERSIYKNGGCNHMTCKCQYEFCWLCNQNFKDHKKLQCVVNITLKIIILIYLLLNLVNSLKLLDIFMKILLVVFRLILFNGSLIFLYLSINELYQISKLNLECTKYYTNGNETFRRIINQKWIMFVVLAGQFVFLSFLFFLCYSDQFLESYCNLLLSEFSMGLVIGLTLWIRSKK